MENKSYSTDNKGLRYDEGKPQYHLFPSDGLRELGRVYTLGAKKYEPYNWERGMAWSRCFNSLLRHLYAFWEGERTDQESGLHHMAHVAWNAIALLVYSLRGIGIDDRKAAFLSARQNEDAMLVNADIADELQALNEKLRNSEVGAVIEVSEAVLAAYVTRKGHPKQDETGGEVERLNRSISSEELKGLIERPMPPVVTNPYALKRRIDIPKDKVNMRCYNCPNDALPHHSVCQECLDERPAAEYRS